MLTKKWVITIITFISMMGCQHNTKETMDKTAADILGNPEYLAISYGGYRHNSRNIQPSIQEIKEDIKILHAMNIRLLRTYNVQYAHASNVLKAIKELKREDSRFEMFVMLGAWIDCKNAWTDQVPDHEVESQHNEEEIKRAIALTKKYSDIVKIVAVGNEAMVHWATSYFVKPHVILKWVNYLQDLKQKGELPKDLWITSSDDFSSWGGGDASYHTKDLENLVRSVDYISMHTYPMHNSHYNPGFWLVPESEEDLLDIEKVESAMQRALEFSKKQYDSVASYIKSLGVNKPIHIGETGWATGSNGHYGTEGSRACDEYKSGRYYELMRKWTNDSKISCFYFEAFDEPWKDALNPDGSENHFGLFTVEGKAKYALWKLVDKGAFTGLTRNGKAIEKTYKGDKNSLLKGVLAPPSVQHLTTQE